MASATLDRGSAGFGVVADQRGFPRPNDIAAAATPAGGDGSDIGAFEFGDSTLRITSIARPANGHFVLQGLGLPNAVHSVQTSSAPEASSFLTLAPILSDATGRLQYDKPAVERYRGKPPR